MPLRISVVINTLNRASALELALLSLRWQTFAHFEVIVVNGPSTDDTEAVLAKHGALNLRTARCPAANLSMSRNIGIALSRGDIVSFMDDDAVAEPEWLEHVAAGFDSPTVGGVGGMVYDNTGHDFQAKYVICDRMGNVHLEFEHNPGDQYEFPGSYEFCSPVGTNCSFLREALLRVGGFDEEYEYYLDETDASLRILDAGYAVRFVDNAYVHHRFLPSDVRNEQGAIKHRYPVLKNKYYFALRNAAGHVEPEILEEHIAAFFKRLKEDAERCRRDGLISGAQADAFEDEARRARLRAKEAAALPRKLMTPPRADAAPLQPFVRLAPAGGSLTVVLLGEHAAPRELAIDWALQGHRVHVIASGEGHDRVDFDSGVWVHRILARPRPVPSEAARLGVPEDLWNRSASMLDELDRIGAHREVSVVAASLAGGEAIAVVLAGRYRVATCFGERPSSPTALQSCLLERTEAIRTEGKTVAEYVALFRAGG